MVPLSNKIHGMAMAGLGRSVTKVPWQPHLPVDKAAKAKDCLGKIECSLYNGMLANLPRKVANGQN